MDGIKERIQDLIEELMEAREHAEVEKGNTIRLAEAMDHLAAALGCLQLYDDAKGKP